MPTLYKDNTGTVETPRNNFVYADTRRSVFHFSLTQRTDTGKRLTAIYADPALSTLRLREILDDLDSILRDEEYDADCLKPTPAAVALTQKVLREASNHVNGFFPAGTIYADGDGGLRLEWHTGNSVVILAVRANPAASYIFVQLGNVSDLKHPFTPNDLASSLNRLTEYA